MIKEITLNEEMVMCGISEFELLRLHLVKKKLSILGNSIKNSSTARKKKKFELYCSLFLF